jgi:DNA-binding NtrC family response regulator
MRSSHVIDAVFGQGVGGARGLTSQVHSFQPSACAGLEQVLLVEPDGARRSHLRDAVREVADIDVYADFVTARAQLFSKPYGWLVTNARLGAYNGLHLVHLTKNSRLPIRSLVYSDDCDLWLAREAQRVGAFYESRSRVDRALPAYLRGAPLPQEDRRSPADPDRRAAPRGGRRCTDSSTAASLA